MIFEQEIIIFHRKKAIDGATFFDHPFDINFYIEKLSFFPNKFSPSSLECLLSHASFLFLNLNMKIPIYKIPFSCDFASLDTDLKLASLGGDLKLPWYIKSGNSFPIQLKLDSAAVSGYYITLVLKGKKGKPCSTGTSSKTST